MAKVGKVQRLSAIAGGLAKAKGGIKFSDKIAQRKDSLLLKDLRKKRGFTLAELAELTGISPSYISRLEAGGRRMNSDLLMKFSSALGCSEYELVKSHLNIEGEHPHQKMDKEVSYLPQKDLPVYKLLPGDAVPGGKAEDYPVGNFDALDHKVFRLPYLLGIKSAFALQIASDENAPKYRKGDLVFINPDKPISKGNPIVLISEKNEVIIGELTEWDDTMIVVKNFKSEKTAKFSRKELQASYPIICTLDSYSSQSK